VTEVPVDAELPNQAPTVDLDEPSFNDGRREALADH
jgi:hypothetical protein